MATPVLKERPNLTSLTLFFISILWYSATVADSTAYINAAEACNDSFGNQSGVTCNGTNYGITVTLKYKNILLIYYPTIYTCIKSGITVALDVLVSIIILIAWLLNGGLGIFGITTQNNPPSERNTTQNNPMRESKA